MREPPSWGSESFAAWRRRVLIWSEECKVPEKKAAVLIESLKKDTEHKGLKEFITNEIIENTSFDFKSRNVIDVILDKIEEFIDESKWNKMIKLNREFNIFKQAEEENAEEYLLRFNNLETQLKNARVNINDMFLAANLLNKSSFGQHEKENIMANIDMDDEKTILKDIKRKIRRLKAMKEKNDDPKVSLYGNYGRDERSRSFNRSRSRQRESRNSSRDERSERSDERDRRSGSRGYSRGNGGKNTFSRRYND